ncbi:hypothetical protein BJP08_01090 [Corynebacterium sp. NML140438]|uniref:glycosyltransferase n=1 Tax=Corynebacterium sp. NML140438 TaxID=1906334 RepID=UPI0008FB0948|nr:glycosyltransferase [Corynebacterium sp. NML140438]OIR44889.1 hypothetical protein BJP08_01090 [Corynebacterium sp. NML140438]
MPLLSVIIPSFNVSGKIARCFTSLDRLYQRIPQIEVIFVDDCSTDDTFGKVKEFASGREWVKVARLESNTGTPSVPRNVGLEMATGKYIFHLDPDDEILPEGIAAEIELAESTGADFVRAPLIRDNGRETVVMNRITGWDAIDDPHERIAKIVREHSTTVCSLYRRDFLLEHEFQWPEDLRLAEDAIYLYRALSLGHVEYSDVPDFVYHVSLKSGNASSTQQYQDRELSNHLRAWRRSNEILKKLGIDYFALRGQVAVSAAIQNMIRFNKGGFSRSGFNELRRFFLSNKKTVESFTYGPRFTEVCKFILEGDYDKFLESIKIRLLIAGPDLRFILPSVPVLSQYYQVRVDEWAGHEAHDESQSKRLLDWADAIHCEWLLGNAVWYSQNKRPRQSLTIRLHRFETSKNYGNLLNRENVDRIITIAPAMFEETQRVFGFEREKVAYVPNYIESEKYKRVEEPEKVFNLVMVGSIPIRKGYRRALELLNSLHSIDSRYNLTVYGKRPDELGWVYNNPTEREYFAECERFIRMNGLSSAVRFRGWVDTKTELADKGFVLSMSDAEGSHVAAAEGFAAGNITLLRPWSGAEFMYPKKYIFEDILEMRDFVLDCRDFEYFEEQALEGRKFVEELYAMERFLRLYGETVPVPYSVP